MLTTCIKPCTTTDTMYYHSYVVPCPDHAQPFVHTYLRQCWEVKWYSHCPKVSAWHLRILLTHKHTYVCVCVGTVCTSTSFAVELLAIYLGPTTMQKYCREMHTMHWLCVAIGNAVVWTRPGICLPLPYASSHTFTFTTAAKHGKYRQLCLLSSLSPWTHLPTDTYVCLLSQVQSLLTCEMNAFFGKLFLQYGSHKIIFREHLIVHDYG